MSGTRKRLSPRAARELALYEEERERARAEARHQAHLDVMATPLPDPSKNRIGKFSAPAAGAPATQRDAAILVYPRTGIARERVLALILGSGELGVTDEEGMSSLRMAQNTYRPRRNELMNDGWIRDDGVRRPTLSGAAATAWVATPEARRMVRP